MESLRLLNKIPAVMRSTGWKYLVDSLDVELQSVLSAIAEKKNMYDVENLDYLSILNLCNQLRIFISSVVYSPDKEDLTVLSDDPERLAFIRREVLTTPFKIAYKSTPIFYMSLYKAISRNGQLFIYGVTPSNNIVRVGANPIPLLGTANPSLPFFFSSDGNYSGSSSAYVKLDSGRSLDGGWKLDQQTSFLSTNHFGIEILLDRLINKITATSSQSMLLSNGFFKFIGDNVDHYRRVREVPHVGAQFGMLLDPSGYIDSPSSPRSYTIPTLNANAICCQPAVLPTLSSARISKIQFGVGSQVGLRSHLVGSGIVPTALQLPIDTISVIPEEVLQSSGWIMAAASYNGRSIGRILLNDASGSHAGGTGATDGINHLFTGTLSYAPIRPRSIQIEVTHQTVTRIISDDGSGKLYGDGGAGTIDYATGVFSLDTTFHFAASDVAQTVTAPGTTSINATLPFDAGSSIDAGSLWVTYIIGGRTYLVHDDGANGLYLADGLNPHIISGSINYTSGALLIVFNTQLDYSASGIPVMANYTFLRSYTPDISSSIIADSYITNQGDPPLITEAGVFLDDGTMLAYMTFPPVEMDTIDYHLSVHFYMSQNNFA